MPTDRAVTATPGRRGAGAASRDSGFSVLEVMVAIAIIGTLMTALTPFLTRSLTLVHDQRADQAAVEVANDAVERVRALDPSSLLSGRGADTTLAQWNAAPTEVRSYLNDTERAWDDTSPTDAGARAPLPTQPRTATVGDTEYQQSWYVGRCWQPRTDPTRAEAAVPNCTAPQSAQTTVPFFRVIVSVTQIKPTCERACVYATATLVSASTDPTFDIKRPPPTVTKPDPQYGYVGVPLPEEGVALAATGGWMPRTWTATGLPPGLILAADTGVITGTPTAAGSYTVTVRVTDRDSKSDDDTFTWTVIAAPPVLTNPGVQTTYTGVAVSLPVTVTGGHLPRTWTATGLPAGLNINTATGVITGTTAAGQERPAAPVTVTVTDAGRTAVSVTFPWQVQPPPPLELTNPGAQVSRTGQAVSLPLTATGLTPRTWSATNLPTGLSINAATGVITGTPTTVQTRTVSVTVRDPAGQTSSATVNWRVLTPVQITGLPSEIPVTRGQNAGGFAPGVSGGVGPYTWSSRNLPDGLTFSSTTGTVTGTLTAAGRYITTLTVQDGAGGTATATVVVTVSPAGNGDLRITSPAGANRSNALGATVSVTAAASPGNGGTWSATGLPDGLTVDPSNGTISGRPTARGAYVIKLTVQRGGQTANVMFVWTIT